MKRRDEVSVGIIITVAVVILLLGTLWLIRGGLKNGYPLHTRFAWGQNLKQGQPVLLAGVSVGYVGDVTLRRDGYLDGHGRAPAVGRWRRSFPGTADTFAALIGRSLRCSSRSDARASRRPRSCGSACTTAARMSRASPMPARSSDNTMTRRVRVAPGSTVALV